VSTATPSSSSGAAGRARLTYECEAVATATTPEWPLPAIGETRRGRCRLGRHSNWLSAASRARPEQGPELLPLRPGPIRARLHPFPSGRYDQTAGPRRGSSTWPGYGREARQPGDLFRSAGATTGTCFVNDPGGRLSPDPDRRRRSAGWRALRRGRLHGWPEQAWAWLGEPRYVWRIDAVANVIKLAGERTWKREVRSGGGRLRRRRGPGGDDGSSVPSSDSTPGCAAAATVRPLSFGTWQVDTDDPVWAALPVRRPSFTGRGRAGRWPDRSSETRGADRLPILAEWLSVLPRPRLARRRFPDRAVPVPAWPRRRPAGNLIGAATLGRGRATLSAADSASTRFDRDFHVIAASLVAWAASGSSSPVDSWPF